MSAPTLTIQEVFTAVGSRQPGTYDTACPFCSAKRKLRNQGLKVFRIWIADATTATFKCIHCDVRGRARGGDRRSTAKSAIGPAYSRQSESGYLAKSAKLEADRTAAALGLWNQATDPAGTPVATYLASRGVTLPPGAAGGAIRWHPACPFGKGVTTPCMVALVRDIHTDAPLAIHRTAIDRHGRKAEHGGLSRMTLGPMAGGAVKLTPDAEVTLGLGIGEGLESTLSLRGLPGCEDLAVWALLAANQLAAFPVLPGLDGLWIAVDHDLTGMAAAHTVRDRWNAAGVEVISAKPQLIGCDLNDVVGAGHGR